MYLKEEGSLCEPKCVAVCGNLILAEKENSNDDQKIVKCFKQYCNCKSLDYDNMMDIQLFKKYQQDLRLEHLLLEKEISSYYNYL